MKKILQSSLSYSFHYPQWKTARANVTANLRSLNKLPNTRVFVAAENGSVEVLELVALILLKTETFGAKNWKEISVDAISCFVEIFSPNEKGKYTVTLIDVRSSRPAFSIIRRIKLR